MKAKRTSIKDIAERLGVSTALVSYVLSGQEREKRVGKEMANRIRAVANELNYTPNQIAQSLRKGTTKTIGLIVADIANPFFGSMARFIEDEAHSHGYNLIIGSSDEDCDRTEKLVNTFINRQVDGFIVVPTDGKTEYLKLIFDNELPLVLIDRYIPGLQTSHVIIDNFQASFDATKCLLNRGCKRIGLIAYKSSLIHMKERIRGYKEAMISNGLSGSIVVMEVEHNHLKRDIRNALKEIIQTDNSVEGILFATNALTISGMYYLVETGIRIPDDIAIIGFDGNEAFDFFYSPLTYIKQPIEEMSKEAVGLLIDKMKGVQQVSQVTMKPKLIRRSSC